MATRGFDPLRLDVQAFANDGGELQGRWPLGQLQRVGDVMLEDGGASRGSEIAWSARGELLPVRGAPPQVGLHLKAAARLPLQCQRCLQAVETPLEIDRRFRFVPGEDAAAQLDAESDDDVLALTRALDLQELVEDELLLALPLVPRHEQCPSPLLPAAEPEAPADDRLNPFAALEALRRDRPLN
jgi:uncharacterized protein